MASVLKLWVLPFWVQRHTELASSAGAAPQHTVVRVKPGLAPDHREPELFSKIETRKFGTLKAWLDTNTGAVQVWLQSVAWWKSPSIFGGPTIETRSDLRSQLPLFIVNFKRPVRPVTALVGVLNDVSGSRWVCTTRQLLAKMGVGYYPAS